MLQSEIGAARCNHAGSLPAKGLRLRDFELLDVAGRAINVSDFRGKFNLVLLFLGPATPAALAFAHQVATRSSGFQERQSKVLLVFLATKNELTSLPNSGPLIIVPDSDARAHTHHGAASASGPAQACYIADRFGEVFAAFRTCDGDAMPTIDSLFEWLDFIEAQCPECEPPEWPADAV